MSHPILSRRGILAALAMLFVLPLQGADAPSFSDPFTADAKVPERRAIRGDWQIAGGIAKCTQDDALYKQYKNHGPIIFYDLPTTDPTIRFQIKPAGCKTVVFTLNGKNGHTFRFVTSERGTSVRAFPPGGETKSIETARENDWVLVEGEWTAMEVKIRGGKAIVKFGGDEPATIEHATYAQPKTNLSVGFAFGTLEVKGVKVTQ